MTSKNAQPSRILSHPPSQLAEQKAPEAATSKADTQTKIAVKAAGVSLRSVTKKYGPITAIENITLDIPAGAYCCLLGPSGCGKTTALRMIAGHEAVTAGEVYIGNRQVTHLPPAQRNTAMMFQNYALFPHKTIWQNVEFGLKMQRLPKAERTQRVGEILDLVGLSHTADRKPDMLSGGQQQRIALARALVTRPQVLMLDEPLSALDENLRVRMRSELKKIQQQFGLTFIQVTHHVEEAFSLSAQVVVMNHGHIDQVATPTDLFSTPASQFVAKFIGDNNIFSGRVLSTVSQGDKDLIELSVEGVGSMFCQGIATLEGTEAACSVRPDLMQLVEAEDMILRGSGLNVTLTQNQTAQNQMAQNQIAVRVSDVEMTGYVTRISLIAESTGQTLLHKVRTTDWMQKNIAVGQRLLAQWPAQDSVFLPY
ncbi:MAG: ABC transporter ATP-binding protein [Cyanobacteria bacterium J06560_2]